MSMVSLSGAELEALPLGAVVYDCDGDELTRVELGWRYRHFDHPVLTSGEMASFYAPVTLEWSLQDKDLWDFRYIYQKMTDEEQQAVAAIVDAALRRANNERETTDVE